MSELDDEFGLWFLCYSIITIIVYYGAMSLFNNIYLSLFVSGFVLTFAAYRLLSISIACGISLAKKYERKEAETE